jgi:hypothetical protein
MTTDDPKTREQPFVDQLRTGYRPSEMSAAERVAFDEAVVERATRPASFGPAIPIAAGLLATAAAVWLALVPTEVPTQDVAAVTTTITHTELQLAPADEAVLDLGTRSLADLEDSLPDEYRAIGEIFLGEV